MLAATGAMLGVALAVPGAFGDDAVLFGAAYLLVRLLHFFLSAILARDDPDRRGVLLRFAPSAPSSSWYQGSWSRRRSEWSLSRRSGGSMHSIPCPQSRSAAAPRSTCPP